MVRISSRGPHSEYLTRTRQLPINVRRGHHIDNVWRWCDLPIRLSDMSEPGPYELQVMCNWGSWKAMLGMMSEQDMCEGVGVRVALALARENPW